MLNRKRVKRGSIDFDLPEARVLFDETGEMTGIERTPRLMAHSIIEEFMLAPTKRLRVRSKTTEFPPFTACMNGRTPEGGHLRRTRPKLRLQVRRRIAGREDFCSL